MANQKMFTVLLIGELLVNAPVPLIMLGAGFLFQSFTVSFYWGLGVGFVLALAYRLKLHAAWHSWAISTGINELQLHRYATYGLLGWKRDKNDIIPDKNPEDRPQEYQ